MASHQIIKTLRAWFTVPKPRPNFYLLTSALIDRALAAETFGELDEVRQDFQKQVKAYATHEDFQDATQSVLRAIAAREDELHTINFS